MTADVLENTRKNIERSIAEAIELGGITRPDPADAFHSKVLGIVHNLANQYGIPAPGLLFAVDYHEEVGTPVVYPLVNIIEFPESADYYLTDREITALLIHEFDHILSPELLEERVLIHHQIHRYLVEKIEQGIEYTTQQDLREDDTLMQLIERMSALSDIIEIKADERVIREGYAADMASALQKMQITDFLGEEAINLEPEEAIARTAIAIESLKECDLLAAAAATSETFVQRLNRLEMAAEAAERYCL